FSDSRITVWCHPENAKCCVCLLFLSYSTTEEAHVNLEVGRNSSRGLLSWWADFKDGEPALRVWLEAERRGSSQRPCASTRCGKRFCPPLLEIVTH
ncbi:mCG64328, partial [Mus musculus]